MWFKLNKLAALLKLLIVLLLFELTTSDSLEVNQIVDLKQTGGIGCVLYIHKHVEECKHRYEQRISNRVKEGYTKTSEEFRKDMCCGFWSLRDCVADAARKQCDEKSARQIENMKIYQSEQQNVLIKQCEGFEYGSKKCGCSSVSASIFVLIVASLASLLFH